MRKTNKILTMILSIVMILTITYQPIEASATNIKPVVKASQKVISKGTTTKLKVTYNKKNVTNKAKFITSNKKVATVNKKGIVTGKKAGTAYITATYKGKTSKKVKITVAQVNLNKSKVKLTVGKTATLTAKYNGKKVKPIYKSNNAAVASVNKSGRITAKKAGTATITVTYKKSKVSCKVTVSYNECEHDFMYNHSITIHPTCTKGGVKTYICKKCGETRTENTPALGHTWNTGTTTTKPINGKGGVKTYTCKRCGKTRTESFDGYIWDEEVTEYVQICGGCGKIFSPTEYSYSTDYADIVAEYGPGTAATDAVGEHLSLTYFFGDCQNYHSSECTFTLRHDTVTGKTWVASTEWDKTVTEDIQVCNGCGKIFSVAEYGSADAATDAAAEHVASDKRNSNCGSYRNEKCTFTIREDPAKTYIISTEWDETVTETVQVCNGCEKIFSVAEYGSVDAATDAAAEHIASDDWWKTPACYRYDSCERTFTIRHDTATDKIWVIQ